MTRPAAADPSRQLTADHKCRRARNTKSAATIVVLLGCFYGADLLAAAVDSSTISALKQLNVEDLLNVEVTSVARRPEKLFGAAAAVQVITREQIQHSGAATLPEALRLADNLQVAQRGARGWAVSARGFNTDLANKLLVMIDGRTVYTPLYSGVFWEAQDYLLEDVERIEVISGPGGTLWGANAVNGVINIITRSAADSQGLYAEAGGGSEVTSIAGLRYGGSLAPDTRFRVYAKHLDHDDSVFADGTPALDAWHRSQAGFRTDSDIATGGALTTQGDFYDNQERNFAAGGSTILRGANLLGRWSNDLSGESQLSLQAYYDWTHLSAPVGIVYIGTVPIAPAGRLQDDLQTFDLDFQHRFRLGAVHGITWGVGFRNTHDVVDNAPGLAFLPDRLNQQLYSAFVQDELRLRADLSVTAGTKIEHNDYTGWEFEPSARLQWLPTATQTFWAAISRAIRAPSRIDRDLSEPAPPYLGLLKGSPDFRSEKVIAYELGHRAHAGSMLTTSVSIFYNVYKDVRSTNITATTLIPFYFANDVAGHSHGAELTGTLQLTDRWTVHAGYNFLKESLHVKPGGFDLSNALNETADPKHQVALRSSLSLPGRLDLDAGLRWVDTLHNNNASTPGTVPDYFELEARLAWRATSQLELSITGQNLLHDQHPEYGFPTALRTEAERSIFGRVVWRY